MGIKPGLSFTDRFVFVHRALVDAVKRISTQWEMVLVDAQIDLVADICSQHSGVSGRGFFCAKSGSD